MPALTTDRPRYWLYVYKARLYEDGTPVRYKPFVQIQLDACDINYARTMLLDTRKRYSAPEYSVTLMYETVQRHAHV